MDIPSGTFRIDPSTCDVVLTLTEGSTITIPGVSHQLGTDTLAVTGYDTEQAAVRLTFVREDDPPAS